MRAACQPIPGGKIQTVEREGARGPRGRHAPIVPIRGTFAGVPTGGTAPCRPRTTRTPVRSERMANVYVALPRCAGGPFRWPPSKDFNARFARTNAGSSGPAAPGRRRALRHPHRPRASPPKSGRPVRGGRLRARRDGARTSSSYSPRAERTRARRVTHVGKAFAADHSASRCSAFTHVATYTRSSAGPSVATIPATSLS